MGLDNPGVPGSQLPAGEAHVMRHLADLERSLRELRAVVPLVPGIIWNATANFSLTTTFSTVLVSTLTVPAGFTRAMVTATGRAIAENSSAATDFLLVQTSIGGFSGNFLRASALAGGYSGINVAPFVYLLTDLVAGDPVDVVVQVRSQNAAWAINVENMAELSGTVIWLR